MIDQSNYIIAAAMIYGAWETLKVVGIPHVIREKIVGTKSALTDKEKEEARKHFEQCRQCVRCQNDQVGLLQKISDTAIEIKTLLKR